MHIYIRISEKSESNLEYSITSLIFSCVFLVNKDVFLHNHRKTTKPENVTLMLISNTQFIFQFVKYSA